MDIVTCAWAVLQPLAYDENDFTIISTVNSQSPDISQSISKSVGKICAGDQGIVFGFAVNETKELMPLPIMLAHDCLRELENKVNKNNIEWIKADAKSQVTIHYTDQNTLKIPTMLMSVRHSDEYSDKELNDLISEIMISVAKKRILNLDFTKIINPCGKFTIGGSIGDTVLTGRKIIVVTYGGYTRHGGGAFRGKDPTKVDTCGSY